MFCVLPLMWKYAHTSSQRRFCCPEFVETAAPPNRANVKPSFPQRRFSALRDSVSVWVQIELSRLSPEQEEMTALSILKQAGNHSAEPSPFAWDELPPLGFINCFFNLPPWKTGFSFESSNDQMPSKAIFLNMDMHQYQYLGEQSRNETGSPEEIVSTCFPVTCEASVCVSSRCNLCWRHLRSNPFSHGCVVCSHTTGAQGLQQTAGPAGNPEAGWK